MDYIYGLYIWNICVRINIYICICSSVFEVVTFENYPLTQGDYGPFVSHIITNIYFLGQGLEV